jgi:hypothetical protein
MPSIRTAGAPPSFRELGKERWATYVSGPHPSLTQWVAHAMSLAFDPHPIWVDFREEGAATDEGGPIAVGEIPADRLYIISKAEARPREVVSARGLLKVVRSDEPKGVLAEIADFSRLPEQVQSIIGVRGGTGPQRAFVLANTDRVREYYPRTVKGIRPLVEVALRENLLPIFVSLPPNNPGYLALDFAFEVRAKSLADWREGILYCEKAPGTAAFVPGQAFRLSSFPEIVSVLGHRYG